MPVDVFGDCKDLLSFREQWSFFLEDHASEISESLAKKLDGLIVTNGDIHKELLKSGRSFDETRGFSEWEQYYRRIFNKLVTRQLFEEVQQTQETIEHYIDTLSDTFTKFPPYVNDIFQIYPFQDGEISAVDTSFHADMQSIDVQVAALQKQYPDVSDEERKKIRNQLHVLKTKKEERRWQAYIAFLRTKQP